MMVFRHSKLLAAVICVIPFVVAASAEQPCSKLDDGRVAVHLKDPWCKAGVAKASITIRGARLKRSYKTDAADDLEACLPPGVYTVTVEKYGFKRYVVNDLKIAPGETSPVNLDMEAGWATDDPNAGKHAPCAAPPERP